MLSNIRKEGLLIIFSVTLGAILSHQLSNPNIIKLINQINYSLSVGMNSIALSWILYFIIVGIFAGIIFLIIYSLVYLFLLVGRGVISLFEKLKNWKFLP